MEFIKVGNDRYLVKNSNGKIVSKKEMEINEDSTVKEAEQVKRTDSKSKRTRN